MVKFSDEEKLYAVQLVESGKAISVVSRQTGISHSVIKRTLEQCRRNGRESLRQHNPERSAEEKYAILQYMGENRLNYTETSLQFAIKGSDTVRYWDQRYKRYGMAGLDKKNRGRPKKWRPPDETMTREEQLEAENLYLRAEVAYLKKLNALVAEREKKEQEIKQQLSRN